MSNSDPTAFPYDEEFDIHPGLYGKRLADFLTTHLRAEGFVVDDPADDDWG